MESSDYRKFLIGFCATYAGAIWGWNKSPERQQFLNVRGSLFPLEIIIFNFDPLMLYSDVLCFGNFLKHRMECVVEESVGEEQKDGNVMDPLLRQSHP